MFHQTFEHLTFAQTMINTNCRLGAGLSEEKFSGIEFQTQKVVKTPNPTLYLCALFINHSKLSFLI